MECTYPTHLLPTGCDTRPFFSEVYRVWNLGFLPRRPVAIIVIIIIIIELCCKQRVPLPSPSPSIVPGWSSRLYPVTEKILTLSLSIPINHRLSHVLLTASSVRKNPLHSLIIRLYHSSFLAGRSWLHQVSAKIAYSLWSSVPFIQCSSKILHTVSSVHTELGTQPWCVQV